MFLPAGKESLLKVFFKDPWAEFHQREMARRANVPAPNAHKHLREFAENGLLVCREVSKMSFFRPNWESARLLKIFEIFEISKREEFFSRNKSIARLLMKATDTLVEESFGHIQLVMLFGSVARETWTPKSDIDLLAVASTLGDPVTKAFTKAKAAVQSVLELAPVYTSIQDSIIGFRERRAFYQEAWGDRVVLYNEFLFWQIVKRGFLAHG